MYIDVVSIRNSVPKNIGGKNIFLIHILVHLFKFVEQTNYKNEKQIVLLFIQKDHFCAMPFGGTLRVGLLFN